MDAEINKNLEKFQKSLLAIGFSENGAEKQINDLEKIMVMSVTQILLEKKMQKNQKLSDADLKNFLKNNYSQEEISKIASEESEKLFNDYVNTITKDLSKDKKQKFFASLKA